MSERHLKIILMAGILIIFALTGLTEALIANGHDHILRVDGKVKDLSPAFRSLVIDALAARGHDTGFLHIDETPEVAPIIGGTDSTEYKHPYFVQVVYFYFDDNFYFVCGGSIYNERTIITAAHCFKNDPEQKDGVYAIFAGDHNRSVTEGLEQVVMAEDIRMHKGFRDSGAYEMHDDIALVILDKPLNFTTIAVRPVPMLSIGRTDKIAVKSDNCVLVGYGTFVQLPGGDQQPSILQELSPVNIASNRDCRKALWETERCLTHKMVCSIDQNAGGCHGDSGGPVGCYDKSGVFYQVGLVSWSPIANGKCGGQTVYTRISKYIEWIKYYSYKV